MEKGILNFKCDHPTRTPSELSHSSRDSRFPAEGSNQASEHAPTVQAAPSQGRAHTPCSNRIAATPPRSHCIHLHTKFHLLVIERDKCV